MKRKSIDINLSVLAFEAIDGDSFRSAKSAGSLSVDARLFVDDLCEAGRVDLVNFISLESFYFVDFFLFVAA